MVQLRVGEARKVETRGPESQRGVQGQAPGYSRGQNGPDRMHPVGVYRSLIAVPYPTEMVFAVFP